MIILCQFFLKRSMQLFLKYYIFDNFHNPIYQHVSANIAACT